MVATACSDCGGDGHLYGDAGVTRKEWDGAGEVLTCDTCGGQGESGGAVGVLRHVRNAPQRRDRRIAALRSPIHASTICGADVTSYDWDRAAARRATPAQLKEWNVCTTCTGAL